MSRLARWSATALVVFLINTAYITADDSPTVIYMASVVMHLLLGCALTLAALVLWRRGLLDGGGIPVLALLISAASALSLVYTGNVNEHRWLLITHVVSSVFAVVCWLVWICRRAARFAGSWSTLRRWSLGAALLAVVLPAGVTLWRRWSPDPRDRIRNSLLVAASMEEEGGGPKSPFFPSAAETNVGGIIPANFFMDSQYCGECHKDIYDQWKGSAHHFASMNNQFYRKSIEHMQDVVGTQPTKWCAGCHDHAMFFNGRFDRPVRDQISTPEAHAGLACTSCHSIRQVGGTVGNGALTVEYPALHELASSRNKYLRMINHFLTYLEPEPHRKTFMKPFMRLDASEFCSSCHKVHLDVPVNSYRWFRGFNDYDSWQASGVSGQGARSFYYPAKSSTCTDCHMPTVRSRDPGHRNGLVHSHRFAGANTALPFVNNDAEQYRTVESFLKSGFVTVDVFAASPVEENPRGTAMIRRSGEGPQLMSSFAVGEEGEQAGDVTIREVGQIAAPLNRTDAPLVRGRTVRLDVVARTRRVGHFFPGGTVDAFDVWMELQAKDATGRVIFRSGNLEGGNSGPVDRGAHFYRALLLDAEGNPINKRNAWQARSVLYVRLIPPGAADVVHYRMKIPRDVNGPVTVTARLNYRKFSDYYTRFSYAGKPLPGQDASLMSRHHDSREYSFNESDIPANVSGEVRGRIPELPVITLAESSVVLGVRDRDDPALWKPIVAAEDRERWNDWGIGLLLQGDLKGAEYGFQRVIEAEPDYADGWLNVARAFIQEGETDAAKPYVDKALQLGPDLGRVHFFRAMIRKVDGDYDGALESLRIVGSKYPRDRVALNQMARILFLRREYRAAIEVLKRVCEIDPEDVQMHYTMMLCYRGLGDAGNAAREQALFRRFKAEELAQSITAKRRLVSAEDNNERQQIHDHDTAPLAARPMLTSRRKVGTPVSGNVDGGGQ